MAYGKGILPVVGQVSACVSCSFGILMWAMLAGREAEGKTKQTLGSLTPDDLLLRALSPLFPA